MTHYFLWERAPSPHLGNILENLASTGAGAEYVVASPRYHEREEQGWSTPNLKDVPVRVLRNSREISAIIESSRENDVHICAGIRSSRFIRGAVRKLRQNNRRFFVFMETIDERSAWAPLKRIYYRKELWRNRSVLEGVLAAGADTPAWVRARGMPAERVHDFAYFLPESARRTPIPRKNGQFSLLFVGSLIDRKRVDLVIDVLAHMPSEVRLEIVGDGPLRGSLERRAKSLGLDRVIFHGTQSMNEIGGFMANADCLVLPSSHDGWGSVIPEAMMVGTPVVCSDGCGAREVVRASGTGQIFVKNSRESLQLALARQVTLGRPSDRERNKLAAWARRLTAPVGAAYLKEIIEFTRREGCRPCPPWLAASIDYHQYDDV